MENKKDTRATSISSGRLFKQIDVVILPRLLSRVRERRFIPGADNRPGRPLTERN